ncbi:MAG: helix-turn-helix transcriptional regulator [Magnetococcales bacterium]|nr:helix-turn-helix transcriptional regulator [Magnetococcales bacterium]
MTMNESFKNRMSIISRLLGNAAILARKSGISRRAIGMYLAGESSPTLEKLVAMAKAAEVNPGWLATGEGPMHPGEMERTLPDIKTITDPQGEFVIVPRIMGVVAIPTSQAWTHEDPDAMRLAFKKQWIEQMRLDPGQIALCVANGDAMSPTIMDGDILLVDLRKKEVREDGVYVLRHDDALHPRRLQRDPRGLLHIRSDNPVYAPITLTQEEILRLSVLGKVVWEGRRV